MARGLEALTGFRSPELRSSCKDKAKRSHKEEFLVLESILKCKYGEHGAGWEILTCTVSFCTDELGCGCGKLV